MTPKEKYMAWVSRPEIQSRILTELDRLAQEGPLDKAWWLGICWHLDYATDGRGKAYAFIATHSDDYNEFQFPFVTSVLHRWEEPNRSYRQQWCANFAQALRANPNLFTIPPTKIALEQLE